MKKLLTFENFVNEQRIYNKLRPLAKEVISNLKPLVKKVFNLERSGVPKQKINKPIPDVKQFTDKLKVITKRKSDGGVYQNLVARVESIVDNGQYVDLKLGKDDIGEFYFMSAKMINPIDAGKSFKKLLEFIPKGARFREGNYGSLSTDSFYSVLRRCKDAEFHPKVIGLTPMNGAGQKRFQEFASKGFENSQRLGFKDKKDAEALVDALNKEISKVLPNVKSTTKSDNSGIWEIFIPNIQLIKK